MCERFLAEQCARVALNVRKQSLRLLRKLVNPNIYHEIEQAEYVTLSESAVFLAFMQLGGNIDAPEAFPWAEQHLALCSAATRHLRRDLRATGSDYWAIRQRELKRKSEVAIVEQFRWDAWRMFGNEDPARRTTWIVTDADDERAALRDTLLGIEKLIRPLLNEQEWYWMDQHYLQGRSCEELAQELMTTNAKYQDRAQRAGGLVRTTLMRARRKVREALGPDFEALAKAVV